MEDTTLAPTEQALSSAQDTFPPETYISNSFLPLVKVTFSVGPTIIFLNSQTISFLSFFFFFWQAGCQAQSFANARWAPYGPISPTLTLLSPRSLITHSIYLVGWLVVVYHPHRSMSSIRQRLTVVLASVCKCRVCFRDMHAHTHCMTIEVEDSSGCWDWWQVC